MGGVLVLMVWIDLILMIRYITVQLCSLCCYTAKQNLGYRLMYHFVVHFSSEFVVHSMNIKFCACFVEMNKSIVLLSFLLAMQTF